MTSLLNHRIVFGLFVLIVVNKFFVEAAFKVPRIKEIPVPHQPQSIASTSAIIQPNRQSPSFLSTSRESFHSIGLDSSASSHSHNNANSPAILQETEALHNQAASVLNIASRFNLENPARNTYMQRLRPSPEKINTYVK